MQHSLLLRATLIWKYHFQGRRNEKFIGKPTASFLSLLQFKSRQLLNTLLLNSLLTAERIWFKCDLYLPFMPPINTWNIWIDLRPFLKCKEGPFSRSWRSPRSNSLEIQNDENSKSKLVKTRWNPKFGLSDLENDLLTSMTSKGAQWFFSKITFLKSVHLAEKNEL